MNLSFFMKITYRAYSQDKVYELVTDEERHERYPNVKFPDGPSPCGIQVVEVDVSPQPPANPETGQPAGMYTLRTLPGEHEKLRPAPFVPGSLKLLRDVVKSAIKLKGWSPDLPAEWTEFAANCPQTDDVDEHVRQHPEAFYIPFKDELFSGKAVVMSRELKITTNHKPAKARSTASVVWHNHGLPLSKYVTAILFYLVNVF